MATKKRRPTKGMTWMRVLTQPDLDQLRALLEKTDKKRAEWEYKLHRDNIIIYVPVIPWNSKTRRPNPSMRYMAKFLRVMPTPAGPFQPEYMRHTGQWWPILEASGDIKTIAKCIEEDRFGLCAPYE